MKVLIADDNHFYRRMLAATLTEWGYEVQTAADGEEAWAILQGKDGPRLAIVDWIMPRLDGIELCRRVRSASLVPPPYVMLLTAREGRENIITALEAGADDFVSKPFDRMEMQARLRVGMRIVGLQERLASRVDDLENALSEAQKMEAVGRLAGGLAHDFNNLLMIMSGAADLLKQDHQLAPAARELVDMMGGAVERGSALTRQLLAFSRKQVLQPEILNLSDIVTGAEKLLRRLIGEDIRLSTCLGTDPGLIKADRGQMEQVIMNLVVNSRDAMPSGGTIVIETKRVEISAGEAAFLLAFRPGPYVLLSVRDTGCGMDAETKSHIFEPFFTTKAPGKGTGLGLATVYGIIRQSGGFIQVDSRPGEGTTFRIYLPQTSEAGAPVAASLTPSDKQGKGETILLVEDDDQVRKMVFMTLAGRHYNVLEARDGQEALRVHESWPEPIDLLLTDIVMPHLSGSQVAEQLRRARPELKVLFMSGHTDDSAIRSQVVNSGQPFLQKPFSTSALHRKLREVFRT